MEHKFVVKLCKHNEMLILELLKKHKHIISKSTLSTVANSTCKDCLNDNDDLAMVMKTLSMYQRGEENRDAVIDRIFEDGTAADLFETEAEKKKREDEEKKKAEEQKKANEAEKGGNKTAPSTTVVAPPTPAPARKVVDLDQDLLLI